ncbi:MAG TPA: GNAT family N-acetyltransferase [Terriglobia bacterium]|nr:GNAT family N-acetyltransferase [Terriglobia bacterium]
MTALEVQGEIVSILRQCALGGRAGEIPIDEPLGRSELRFDSLALVEFVSAIETRFGVELPDSIWRNRDQISVRRLVELVSATQPVMPRAAASVRRKVQPCPASASIYERIQYELSAQGIVHTAMWLITTCARYFVRHLYRRHTLVMLTRRLDDIDIPAAPSGNGFVMREVSEEDIPFLPGLWSPHSRKNKLRLFHKRRAQGSICFIAMRERELVGMDWLSPSGDEMPELEVTVCTDNAACYAFDLYEKYRGEGIGLALLEYSLAEAKRRGFRKQVTYVSSENVPMLSAAIHLLGFQTVAMLESTKLLWFMRRRTREYDLPDDIRLV